MSESPRQAETGAGTARGSAHGKVWCPWCHRRVLFEWMPRAVPGRLGLLRVKCKDCRRLATFLLTMDGALSADEHVGGGEEEEAAG